MRGKKSAEIIIKIFIFPIALAGSASAARARTEAEGLRERVGLSGRYVPRKLTIPHKSRLCLPWKYFNAAVTARRLDEGWFPQSVSICSGATLGFLWSPYNCQVVTEHAGRSRIAEAKRDRHGNVRGTDYGNVLLTSLTQFTLMLLSYKRFWT